MHETIYKVNEDKRGMRCPGERIRMVHYTRIYIRVSSIQSAAHCGHSTEKEPTILFGTQMACLLNKYSEIKCVEQSYLVNDTIARFRVGSASIHA